MEDVSTGFNPIESFIMTVKHSTATLKFSVLLCFAFLSSQSLRKTWRLQDFNAQLCCEVMKEISSCCSESNGNLLCLYSFKVSWGLNLKAEAIKGNYPPSLIEFNRVCSCRINSVWPNFSVFSFKPLKMGFWMKIPILKSLQHLAAIIEFHNRAAKA